VSIFVPLENQHVSLDLSSHYDVDDKDLIDDSSISYPPKVSSFIPLPKAIFPSLWNCVSVGDLVFRWDYI
jgi:hypothetical protein